jgi:hypothetical protein
MIQPSNGKGTWLQHARAINNSVRNMGIYCLGGRGTGKSWELSLAIAWQEYLAGIPGVIFDPLGTLSRYFFSKLVRTLTYLPKSERKKVWERIIYVDMSGRSGFVSPFPLYYRQGNETLQEISERLLTVVELTNPGLVSNAPVTWPSTRRLGVHAGTVLAALQFQVTELEDLLFHTVEWEKAGRFQDAITRNPDAIPAVSYFRNSYVPLSRSDKTRLISTLQDHVFKFTSDKNLRAVFAAPAPGVTLERVAAKWQKVFLDFSGISNPHTKRFALLWTFSTLYEFIKTRSRSDPPFGIIVDEFADLATKVENGTNPLATLLDEFIQQYMRNSNIWLTIAHQSVQQIDDQLRNTLLSLGTYLFAQPPTMEAARILADAVFLRDPYRVKYWRPVYGRFLPRGSTDIPEEPQFMPLEEQRELFAQQLRKLPAQQFLLRPAEREGVISTAVYPITIRGVDLDPVTNEYHYPDQTLLDTLYPKLAAKDGIPIQDILKEQETRLTQGISQNPPQQTHTLPDGGDQEQHQLKTDPTLPALEEDYLPDEAQCAFLSFLVAHPDTPISSVYKAVGLSGRKGNEMRMCLNSQGFIQELEVRAHRGRPLKFVIPTMQAFTFLEKDPPSGRGGVIHRHVQQMVRDGAIAKGYSATCEKALGTGGIVDVHLEKGTQRMAVEIAITSTVERESTHIRNCLAAGYDYVYALFADEELEERVEKELQDTCSEDAVRKVRLLPLNRLSQVGYG